jgi:threonine aldolase
MNFSSDNAAGIAPEILAAITDANSGRATAYGGDEVTAKAKAALNALFECEAEIFPLSTGSAANALALAALMPPWGVTYCHRHAHIEEDEAGAPGFFSGGGKLALLDGDNGKFSAAALAEALAGAGFGVEHHPQPAAVSISQASERGASYSPDEIAAIAEVTHKHGLKLHMDGARFGNSVAFLGCGAAEASWRAGVDVLSFGATKNGAMAAEAVLFFKPELAENFLFRRKQAGHLVSKMRFLSAQLLAYVEDDNWLRHARHANGCARTLADGLAALPGAELAHPVEANEIFIRLPEATAAGMARDGVIFHRWEAGPPPLLRLLTAFDTDPAEVEQALAIAGRHGGAD